MDRRSLLAGATALLAACRGRRDEERDGNAASASSAPAPALPIVSDQLRVASVKTAVEGGLLPFLVKQFEAGSRYRIAVTTGTDVYSLARRGAVDLVISHFGHHEAEQFITDGLGEFPRTLFSNQMALVGPPADPAKVRNLDDAGEAFHRIAAARVPFIVNDLDGVKYLTEILWHAAGKPAREGWFLDDERSRAGAIELAAKLGGYTLWGLTPFLRTMASQPVALEPLVVADPLLQRLLVSVVVKSERVRSNLDAAHAFQRFMLTPETQAAIRTVSYPGAERVRWVAAGRHNRTAVLPQT